MTIHGHQRHRKANFVHLHPNTNLNSRLDPNTNPGLVPALALIKIQYWDRVGGRGVVQVQ